MLLVKKWYNGPRAVALQILLNRSRPGGIVLKVDGYYGDKTAKAVQKYRDEVMRMSIPGEPAGPALWMDLLHRASLQVVDAVDITDPMVEELSSAALRPYGSPIELGGMSGGVGQLMADVRARAGRGSMLLFRTHGHGAPGLVAVSHGKRSLEISKGVDPVREQTVLNRKTVEMLRPALGQITPLMCDFGFVEFHACKVALGWAGISFLRTLAHIWRAPVSASSQSQSGEGINNFYLTGRVVTAYPGGVGLRAWAAGRNEAKGVVPTP
jgi:hypothetical protein